MKLRNLLRRVEDLPKEEQVSEADYRRQLRGWLASEIEYGLNIAQHSSVKRIDVRNNGVVPGPLGGEPDVLTVTLHCDGDRRMYRINVYALGVFAPSGPLADQTDWADLADHRFHEDGGYR